MKTETKTVPKSAAYPSTAPLSRQSEMPFGRINYLLMIAGVVVIFLGFIIMSFDTADFGFGFLGLTLGPIVTMAGFMLEFVAILRKPV